MNIIVGENLRQRADYTQRFNAHAGRHGWLRLTPAYSVKMVEELLSRYVRPLRVLDPFCGTATTALSAAYHGHEGVTTDINPFLVWLGQAKTARYSRATIAATRSVGARVIETVRHGKIEPVKAPAMHNLDRWWCREALAFLCALRSAIEAECEADSAKRDLLLVAFCRTLLSLSNAAFNHQSMSFQDDRQSDIPLHADMGDRFRNDVNFVLEGAQENPKSTGYTVCGDARKLADTVDGLFDLAITSPPYANRMSYVRELRPYMYWLGFLDNGRDAGELDWLTIGGTWGIATSRLLEWEQPPRAFKHPILDAALDRISHHDNRNGKLLANYVAKYFADMWAHFDSLRSVLNKGAEVHYIVGNSTFYGVLLPVERLYAAMLERLGFENIECRVIRKRNSKKELFEFDVSARWPG